MVQAVFFDVGSTLLRACPDVPQTFTACAQARGHAVDLDAVYAAMPLADALYDAEYARDGDFWCSHERATAVWKDMYRLLAHEVGLACDAEGIADDTHQQYRHAHHWALYEDVLSCLDALKAAGLRLGLISNWDAELEALFCELGLIGYFDVVVASAAVGVRKPDPAIFEIALAKMGVAAHEAFHVGDLPEADGAALQVGITPVIIDRRGAHADCGFATIRSLTQLPGLLLMEGNRQKIEK